MEHSYIFVFWTMDELIFEFTLQLISPKGFVDKNEFQMAACLKNTNYLQQITNYLHFLCWTDSWQLFNNFIKTTHLWSLIVQLLLMLGIFHILFLVLIIIIIPPSSLKMRHIWSFLKVVLMFVIMRFEAYFIQIKKTMVFILRSLNNLKLPPLENLRFS